MPRRLIVNTRKTNVKYYRKLRETNSKYQEKLLLNIITFASQSHVLEEENEPFLLENISNFTHEFLYDIFNKKILLNFLVKNIIQKLMCQI